jgi:hypothetical protein
MSPMEHTSVREILTPGLCRIEYLALFGSFIFVALEAFIRVLTLALRELLFNR